MFNTGSPPLPQRAMEVGGGGGGGGGNKQKKQTNRTTKRVLSSTAGLPLFRGGGGGGGCLTLLFMALVVDRVLSIENQSEVVVRDLSNRLSVMVTIHRGLDVSVILTWF